MKKAKERGEKAKERQKKKQMKKRKKYEDELNELCKQRH